MRKKNVMNRKMTHMALALCLLLLMSLVGCSSSNGGGVGPETSSPAATESSSTAEGTSATTESESADAAVSGQTDASGSSEPSMEPENSDSIDTAPDFQYELLDQVYEEEGLKILFPQLISESDADKADLVNDIIQEDLRAYFTELHASEEKNGAATMELSYSTESMANNALTVSYSGVLNWEGAAYPQHVYRTIVINLVDPAQVVLTDAFDVGESFAERFRGGMYAPLREDLDLEASGKDITGIIDAIGSPAELAKRLADPSTPFVLSLQGVIVSVPVPHAVGDHLEMAIPYEAVEPQMKRDSCSVWTGYLAMSDNAGAGPAESEFSMLQYENARFGYVVSYPDLFEAQIESDNGDGITLMSADGKVELLIWGQYNLEPVDGAGLLEMARESIAGIESDWSADRLYGVDFEGGDADPVRFKQRGYAGDTASVQFRMSYPLADDEVYADAIDEMTLMLYVE